MATPRVTIDQLPEQTTLEDTNYFVLQDTGVSKKASWLTMKNTPSQALTDHINKTSGAHAATAISATDSGNGVNGTTVQAQLGQVATLAAGKINQTVADGLYVNITGDTMTGPLIVTAPTLDTHAATKKYVDDAIIASGGGITQAQADARYVNIDGDTMTGALAVQALLSTTTGVDLPVGEPSAAQRAARKDYVDTQVGTRLTQAQVDARVTAVGNPLYVDVAGDTMTGPLKINSSGVPNLWVARVDVNAPMLGFYKTDLTTRMGFVQVNDTNWLKIATEQAIPIEFHTGTTPTRRFSISDTVSRCFQPLYIDGQTRLGPSSALWSASGQAIFSLYGNATDAVTLGTRDAYLGENNGTLQLRKETAGAISIVCDTNAILFSTSGAEAGRFTAGGDFVVAKVALNPLVVGPELKSTGQIVSALNAAVGTQNLYLSRFGAADAVGGVFASMRNAAGTQIGSITQATATTTGYNTSSDRRLKTLVAPYEASDVIDRLEPVTFTWINDPEAGEQVGFIAQDAYEVVPVAVAVGMGEPGDEDFTPWGMDNSKLVPYLVAEIQALKARVAQLEAA